MAMRWLVKAALCALLVIAAGCSTVQTTAPGAVGVDRKQQMLLSSQQVDQAAAQAYAKELSKAREQGVLNRNAQQVERVRRIANRLIPQTRVFRPDAVNWNWEVNVQSTKDLNAYCMPGGRIMVYSGLIENLDVSDAELATVIGHEIAHALREHTRERVSRAYAQQLVLSGAAAVAGVGEGTANIANMVAEVTFQLPFSRAQESARCSDGIASLRASGASAARPAESRGRPCSRVPNFTMLSATLFGPVSSTMRSEP